MQSEKGESKHDHPGENPLKPKEPHTRSPEMPDNPHPSDKEPVPRNPLGLPEDYPAFGTHIRIDFVFPFRVPIICSASSLLVYNGPFPASFFYFRLFSTFDCQ